MRYRRGPRTSRQAAVLVLAALLMILMVGMIAFAMDIGYIVLVRSQLQTAADSAAMAAAAVMGGEPGSALKTARQYAAYHTAGGENVQLAEDDVELGVWDQKTRTFVPLDQAGNAVRVTARRETAGNGEAPLFFATHFRPDQLQHVGLGRGHRQPTRRRVCRRPLGFDERRHRTRLGHRRSGQDVRPAGLRRGRRRR